MTARECATCARLFRPRGKARYCSTECRCGTDAGYNAGCRCAGCRRAHSLNHKRLRWHPNPTVSALGTHRRVQALACLGWSTAELSRQMGKHRSYLLKVMLKVEIEPSTALEVARLYDRLCMTRCVSSTAGRTAMYARRAGWPPPLAWHNIDDPDEQPTAWEYRPLDRAELLTELAADGAGISEVCRVLHVNRDSLQQWCSRHDMSDLFRVLTSREDGMDRFARNRLEVAS